MIPRCQILPLPDHQLAVLIEGVERTRWHHGPAYPRPFLYPLLGPSGIALTRMGHPGAPNHDHHRSVWFAHHQVLGIDFWSDTSPAHIRQQQWLAYHDGEEEAVFAVWLGWYDGHDPRELLTQDLVVAVRPLGSGETAVEFDSVFRPASNSLEFGQTNFGFLGVRVAKAISGHFGGGTLVSSTGQRGEEKLFAQPARWMDYSGEIRPNTIEGITYFDHPENQGYPQHWHVREDGWMCASPCLNSPLVTTQEQPLRLRYLLHLHAGEVDVKRAESIAGEFANRAPFEIVAAQKPHEQFIAQRIR